MPLYETLDPSFNKLVLSNAELELLAYGCRWLEGPVWFADVQMLLFSDIPNNRILRWVEGGVSVFRESSHFANGHTRDREGRLIGCSHQARCITRTEHDGSIITLASQYHGHRLNSPNDVVVKSDGSIWFTDPPYGISTDYEGGKQTPELPANVYRLDPAQNRLEIVADDIPGPNGICFSPDESRLYITNTGSDSNPTRHIRSYPVHANGKNLGNYEIFHEVSPGAADGIRCDEAGNIWSSAGDGVHCISPSGKLLGKILLHRRVANLTFGGRNRSRLFICAGTALYAIYTNTRGATHP
jgi:gluconolactonase